MSAQDKNQSIMASLGLAPTYNVSNVQYYSGLMGYWPVTSYVSFGSFYFIFYVNQAPARNLLNAMRKELPSVNGISGGNSISGAPSIIATVKKKTLLAEGAAILGNIAYALDRYGFHPHDNCPYCGRVNCDTVATVRKSGNMRYDLTHRFCLEQNVQQMQEKAAANAYSGSYITGFIGALLGMIAGCIPSVLTGLYLDSIYAILIALIPICSYFGYKLLGGKMDKTPLVLSIIMSIIGIYVMYSLMVIGYICTEYSVTLKEATTVFFMILGTDITFLDITADCFTYFLFAALGVWWSWRIISRSSEGDISDANSALQMSRPWPPVISYPVNTGAPTQYTQE